MKSKCKKKKKSKKSKSKEWRLFIAGMASPIEVAGSSNGPDSSSSTTENVVENDQLGKRLGFSYEGWDNQELETQLEDANRIPLDLCWGNEAFDSVTVNASGRSGGLACLWDPKVFTKTGWFHDRRFIWVIGHIKGVKEVVNAVNVYGPHDPSRKMILWQQLSDLRKLHQGLWILLGDFNSVRFPEDIFHSTFCKSSANDFNRFIEEEEEEELFEYNMGGRKSTYLAANGANLSEIDRVLVCKDFYRSWPEACLTALPREKSDHCPITLIVQKKDFRPTPFKVYN
ncbi:hypothetical protein QVD17_30580 [Tagetes erecta]|uniref:Endonuclease/exonuclease/phosphatase domain-containing protein n=1 Tax=Tagetes erecta TaxID=13708 RepID=A0AAD8K5J6_TARER|nr:hypothetical protein QVD17_30580 [Tagetes erecta]